MTRRFKVHGQFTRSGARQEATLVFVPKILAIFVTLLVALPFMADTLYANFVRIAARIGGGGSGRPPCAGNRARSFRSSPRKRGPRDA